MEYHALARSFGSVKMVRSGPTKARNKGTTSNTIYVELSRRLSGHICQSEVSPCIHAPDRSLYYRTIEAR